MSLQSLEQFSSHYLRTGTHGAANMHYFETFNWERLKRLLSMFLCIHDIWNKKDNILG
jgi:hypothetical protein